MDNPMTASIEPIEDMLKRLNVGAVFGEPIKEGDATILPVASVSYGFGYGAGRGHSPTAADAPETTAGEGEGGGGAGKAAPQGIIRITPDGVKFEAIMDLTRISLAGIALSAWSVFWITMTVRAFVRPTRGKCCG
jgi:uncharacterized spore protein YtfJ